MSEPIARRQSLTDYRITASKCGVCGSVYFPPKSFCNNEGRASKMIKHDYLYEKGSFYSGSVISAPTNKFKYLDSYLSCLIEFNDGFRVPGRVTDHTPSETADISKYIDRPLVPRFRRLYADGEDGLVYYSSLNYSFADEYYPYQEYTEIQPSKEIERPGIVGYGAYIPKYRIKNEGDRAAGVKERTLPYADEDTTTFSVEAGKRALIHAALNSSYIKKVHVGTESPTYAVKPIMATVTQALELGEKYEDGFFSGGVDTQFACKAATDMYIDACALVNYPQFGGEYAMIIGSDNSQAAPGDALDYTVGAGATAYIFGRRDVIATLDHYVSYTSDTPDFYRREHEKYPRHGGRFTGEPAYFKHVKTSMKACLEKSGLTPKDIQYVICHSPNAQFPVRAATEVGFDKTQIEPGLVGQKIGNLYSGSCPTSLAAILDIAFPGDKILMTSYGSGAGSDSYIFTVTPKNEEKRNRLVTMKEQVENPFREYVDYAFYRKMKESA
ncbi:hydroxymethylglutaryl-CoA synthase [Candidatus Bathyarchaeota archaeon]|nr:hydroxymethylglutaryl-CoA synthase [Candidatus Bathyarchaeota archaeon]